MQRMTQMLDQLLAATGLDLPPWAMPLIALSFMALMLPSWRRSHRVGLARKRLQSAAMAGREEREALQAEALGLVAGNPFGLIVVAEECIKRSMKPTAREAVKQLAATGRRRPDLRRLKKTLDGDRRPVSIEGECAAIERFIGEGMLEVASSRLEEALGRWPGEPRFIQLQSNIAQERASLRAGSGHRS